MNLSDIKNKTEELALSDLAEALDYLRGQLPDDSPAESTVLSMIRRLNRSREHFRKGLVPMDDLEIIENQIFDALLAFLRGLNEEKIQGQIQPGTGKILYEIPPRMMMGEEVRCRVRLAFLERILLQNLDLQSYSEVHDVPVGEVMSVELVDPAAEPVFSIRTISDEVQLIDPDFFSEWWFYVKPLKIGQYPLVLRVSIVERIAGADRKRNIVLEEVIDITEVPGEPATVEFRESSVLLQEPRGIEEEEEMAEPGGMDWSDVPRKLVDTPQQPVPPPPPPAPAPQPESPKSARVRIPTWLPLLVIAVVGATFVLLQDLNKDPSSVDGVQWEKVREAPTVQNVQKFLLEHPNEPEMERAVELLLDIPPDRTGGQGPDKATTDSLHLFLEKEVLPKIEDPSRREWVRKRME